MGKRRSSTTESDVILTSDHFLLAQVSYLAKVTGVPISVLSAVFNSDRNPSLSTVMRLARAFKIDDGKMLELIRERQQLSQRITQATEDLKKILQARGKMTPK